MRDRRNPAVHGLAMDRNGDGKPDDVDGDGRIDVADVVRLFNRLCRRRRYHGAPSSGPWKRRARPLDHDRDLEPPEVGPHHTGRPWPFASLIRVPAVRPLGSTRRLTALLPCITMTGVHNA